MFEPFIKTFVGEFQIKRKQSFIIFCPYDFYIWFAAVINSRKPEYCFIKMFQFVNQNDFSLLLNMVLVYHKKLKLSINMKINFG